MSIDELDRIRTWLVANVFRNEDYMFLPYHTHTLFQHDENADSDRISNLLAMVASLYNLLHREVTGEEYNYFFHWANKCGAWVEDCVFDNIIKGGNDLKFYE